MPERMSSALLNSPAVENDMSVCAMSVPFQGKTFDNGYASIHKSGPSYVGLLESAMICVAPLQYT